jgi:hypothetical protein
MMHDEGEWDMGFCKFILVVLVAGIIALPIAANAEDLVSGRYIKAEGKEIVIELEISTPAPPLVIVVQDLPDGVKVVSSRPKLKKYSPKKGIAKWLLHKVKPGKMVVSMMLDRPIGKGMIEGEVRSRNLAGKMVSVDLEH